MDYYNLLRENIKELVPYASARETFEGEVEVLLDANENPFDYSYNRYPDPKQKVLKQAIAAYKNCQASQVFLGNGSDDIIDLLIRTFCEPHKDSIYFYTPTFGMYKVAAQMNAVAYHSMELSEDFSLDENAFVDGVQKNDKLVFVCTPNNPTANLIPVDKIKTILDSCQSLVVVDEAYIDFTEAISCIELLAKYENLVVLQTFSKALGAAGIRMGMGFMHEGLVALLNRVKMPYNISDISQQEALKILGEPERISNNIDYIIEERVRVVNVLETIESITKIYPSVTNFLLIQFSDPKAVYAHLVKDNIVVRDRSSLKGCEGCLRITIGTKAENDRLIDSLKRY